LEPIATDEAKTLDEFWSERPWSRDCGGCAGEASRLRRRRDARAERSSREGKGRNTGTGRGDAARGFWLGCFRSISFDLTTISTVRFCDKEMGKCGRGYLFWLDHGRRVAGQQRIP
jgi:hypothetical protein